jgi:hypothetical protein
MITLEGLRSVQHVIGAEQIKPQEFISYIKIKNHSVWASLGYAAQERLVFIDVDSDAVNLMVIPRKGLTLPVVL